ncbi:MAG: transglutaminase-like domain-containing protein [Acidimicrobiia bacterium]
MRVRVGCQFEYEAPGPTPAVWQVRARLDGAHQVITSTWTSVPFVPMRSYLDGFGNVCDRMTLPEGASSVRYDALVEVPRAVDDIDERAIQVPVEDLPDSALVYLLASRFCLSDLVIEEAWDLFGDTKPGWERVQAVVDWVHRSIRYEMGSTGPHTTSADALASRRGVCRDYTHVGIAYCRALNIPARYVSGYLPDIAVPPPDLPMDFCSWFEAYLGGRWWTFDPRNNVPRMGRVVISRGRDAADVAMATTYGAPQLETMTVWADEVDSGLADLPAGEGAE